MAACAALKRPTIIKVRIFINFLLSLFFATARIRADFPKLKVAHVRHQLFTGQLREMWVRTGRFCATRAAVAAALLPQYGHAQTHLEACEQDILNNRPVSAVESCGLAVEHARSQGKPDLVVEAGLRLSDALIGTGNWGTADFTLDNLLAEHGAKLTDDQRYRLIRRRGSIAFHRENHAQAIDAFEQGLAIAESSENALWLGKSHNDLGAAYRAQGLFGEALNHLLQGLRFKRISGDQHAIATTLNNIGNVYRDMGECTSALDQYRNAVDVFAEALKSSSDQRARLNIAHTRENIGLCHAALGDTEAALAALNTSLHEFQQFSRHQDQVRLQLSLARTNLDSGAISNARKHLAEARNLADGGLAELPMDHFELSYALAMADSDHEAALAASMEGFEAASKAENAGRRAQFARAVAIAYAALGQYSKAYEWQEEHRGLVDAAMEQRYDQELAKNRTLYDLQLREDRIESLSKDIEIARLRQRQWIFAGIAGVLITAAGFGFWAALRRRKHRELQRQLERHRRRAEQLETSSARLHQIIQAAKEPIAVVDPAHRLDVINPAFATWCRFDTDGAKGRPLGELLPGLAADERYRKLSEDEPRVCVEFTPAHDIESAWTADLLLLESGSVVVSLRERKGTAADLDQASILGALQRLDHVRDEVSALLERIRRWRPGDDAPDNTITDELQELSAKMDRIVSDTRVDDLDQQYRSALVALMTGALDVWEATTGTGKIDLAEKSGIWRVNIDDGRLRTRSMDRYFQLNRLPANPRWREVVRTAHFVLGTDGVDARCRERLAALLQRVETLQQAID